MEQNLPIIAKKIWKIVRVVYFMLRKGISKGKLLADLNMILKRGKIAGKAAIQNLMFHHHAASASTSSCHSHEGHFSFPAPLNEYEFSCSNSPAYPIFHLNKRKHSRAPPPIDSNMMAAALEIINSAAASPALPGFGPSPMVRQLRITDSPFPLRDIEEDSHVDEAAEEFIMKFYKDLKRQNSMAYLGYS
ncbi:hypothetical protein Pfo_019969 [Paulownia fortunei]|nr:hypothetical protein Pfo_019969 [Paulownia fortunei]